MGVLCLSREFDPNHLQSIIIKKGEHKEWFWATEFEKAILWLYK